MAITRRRCRVSLCPVRRAPRLSHVIAMTTDSPAGRSAACRPGERGTAAGVNAEASAAVPLPDAVADLARRIHHSRAQVVPLADVTYRLRKAGLEVTLEQVRAAVMRGRR